MSGMIGLGVLALLILILMSVVSYNGIIAAYNQTKQAWADVIVGERQKYQSLPLLEQALAGYKQHERALLESVTQLRSAINNLTPNSSHDAVQQIEQQTQAVLQGLSVTVESYPELKAAQLTAQFMTEIAEQQNNIAAAIRIFNSNVAQFNSRIQQVPGVWVNTLFVHKAEVNVFYDTQASQEFDYQPNMH